MYNSCMYSYTSFIKESKCKIVIYEHYIFTDALSKIKTPIHVNHCLSRPTKLISEMIDKKEIFKKQQKNTVSSFCITVSYFLTVFDTEK